MDNFRETISQKIQHNRPNLGVSSVKTYVSILSNLHKNLSSSDDTLEWFSDDEKNKNIQRQFTAINQIMIQLLRYRNLRNQRWVFYILVNIYNGSL